ncbi:MAG: helix-turn-helix transcriptional regulator [Pseudomonadota bacterium]
MTLSAAIHPSHSAGALVREWRQRRRLSQLACALEAGISQRHLSFIEGGRAQPSRDMVLHLCEHLAVPLRERNAILLAAGYAPVFPERRLDDPALAPALSAVEMLLKGHEPYPALAVDRNWTLVRANRPVMALLGLVADETLLALPVNVLMLTLAPGGLAPHIVNLAEWRAHVLERLRQQISISGDQSLARLRSTLMRLPGPPAPHPTDPAAFLGDVVVPLVLKTPAGVLSLISTTTVFGTPVDVTLSELALETFFPADAATATALKDLAS